MITKEEFDKVVDLKKKGCSYREIEKELGIAHAKISAILSANEIIEAEKRVIEEEKENLRKDTEEIIARKRKIEELKKREKELQAKINESQQESLAAKNEVKRVREEYLALKEEFNALMRDEERVKKIIEEAEDYQKRKKELESEYQKQKNEFEVDLAKYELFRGSLAEMKEKYDRLKDGVKDELIPVFLKLNPREKADIISYLSPNEVNEMIELVVQRKMLEDLARKAMF